jgi:hypothetical protein
MTKNLATAVLSFIFVAGFFLPLTDASGEIPSKAAFPRIARCSGWLRKLCAQRNMAKLRIHHLQILGRSSILRNGPVETLRQIVMEASLFYRSIPDLISGDQKLLLKKYNLRKVIALVDREIKLLGGVFVGIDRLSSAEKNEVLGEISAIEEDLMQLIDEAGADTFEGLEIEMSGDASVTAGLQKILWRLDGLLKNLKDQLEFSGLPPTRRLD